MSCAMSDLAGHGSVGDFSLSLILAMPVFIDLSFSDQSFPTGDKAGTVAIVTIVAMTNTHK